MPGAILLPSAARGAHSRVGNCGKGRRSGSAMRGGGAGVVAAALPTTAVGPALPSVTRGRPPAKTSVGSMPAKAGRMRAEDQPNGGPLPGTCTEHLQERFGQYLADIVHTFCQQVANTFEASAEILQTVPALSSPSCRAVLTMPRHPLTLCRRPGAGAEQRRADAARRRVAGPLRERERRGRHRCLRCRVRLFVRPPLRAVEGAGPRAAWAAEAVRLRRAMERQQVQRGA
eukprot:gene11935-biopygen9423